MIKKQCLVVLIVLCVGYLGYGQISITGLGAGNTYNQNFNTLAISGTSSTVPAGWSFSESGTNANTFYTAGTGSGTAGDTYSFGPDSNTERSLGGLQSGSLNPTIGVGFTNNTVATVTELIISYTGEQWRLGATGRIDRLDFQYSLNATSLTTGTWTDVDNLDFTAPVTTGPIGALNGNLVANRALISFTITGLTIVDGSTFWLRWSDFNASGADDGMAVDDFSIYAMGLADDVDWCNIQSPANGTIDLGNSHPVYARAWEAGVTDSPGQGLGLVCEIGYSSSNSDPSGGGWTWVNAPFNTDTDFGNNDEFMLDLGAQIPAIGTYYYASRFQLNGGPYKYGGYNAGGGGYWDDVYGSAPNDNESGQLIINARTPDWVNLQSPGSTNSITTGTSFYVYAQIYEPGITENSPATPGANIQAWIGYNTIDNDPRISGGWTWVPAGHNALCGANCGSPTENNDEYFVEIGSSLPEGTYYYASRFTIDNPSVYYYGGWSGTGGGFWNNTYAIGSPTDNVSGELIITPTPCDDLFISEYIEGSSLNKCLELFNPTGSSIDLTNYTIELYSNGSGTPSSPINLSGTIASGDTFVICNSGANATMLGLSDQLSGSISFNGDDAVALKKSGSIIDVIGEIGYDPGAAWTGGSSSTLDRTLIRKSTVQAGDSNGSNVFDPNLEWSTFPINYVSELGFHFSSCYPDKELQLQINGTTNISCGYEYDYGTQVIDTNTDVILTIKNLGDVPLQITSLNLGIGSQYSLVSPPGTPFDIAAKSFQNITIRFNPNTIGLFLDTLTINSNDSSESNCVVNLTGISVSNCGTTTDIIAAQDFESSPSDTWIPDIVHAPIPGNWDVTTSLTDIASAQNGSFFWGMTDLERPPLHINQNHTLTFNQNIAGYTNVKLSFYYYTINIDASDSFEYELFYDGVSQGVVDISANNDAWTEVSINIPDPVNIIDFIIYADIDAVNDQAGIDNIELTSTTINTSTWTSSGWDTPPGIDRVAIINSNFNTTTNGSFSACNLIVNDFDSLSNPIKLTISDNTYVEVQNNIVINGEILVENKGSLVQNDDGGTFSLIGTGTSSVHKLTALKQQWYYYTYWSSPVEDETVEGAFPDAPTNRRFLFEASNYFDSGNDGVDDNGDDWQIVAGTDTLTPGVGYAVTGNPFAIGFPYIENADFVGPFNTSDIPTSIYYDGASSKSWNFIGNPYPCALNFDEFYTINSSIIEGAAYFWSQASPPLASNPGNQVLNFSQNDYAIYTVGVGGTKGGGPDVPTQYVPSAQGFFINSKASGNVTFKNSMRVTGNNTQFFRQSGKTKSSDKTNSNKIWIDLTSDNGVFSQILVGYVNGATNDYDGMAYDAPRNATVDYYSIIYTTIEGENEKFAIQGKEPNILDINEVIKLGFNTRINVATLYKLSIEKIEGEFLSSNPIYLNDNFMNIVHNLSESDYRFTSEVGEFKDRFEIVFQSESLSDKEAQLNINKLTIIELNDGRVQLKTNSNHTIKSVQILDLLGRTLYQLKGTSSTEIYNFNNLSQAAYLAKVELSNGQIITKKAIKRN